MPCLGPINMTNFLITPLFCGQLGGLNSRKFIVYIFLFSEKKKTQQGFQSLHHLLDSVSHIKLSNEINIRDRKRETATFLFHLA